nr:phosphoribosylanthranilate isomerase [Synergistes sp.]
TDLYAAQASAADEILLDNGYGTGALFDWSLLAGFARPFILAGGLTPDIISEAVSLLAPKMIDISSGVETERVKDKEKILAAVRAVRGK